MNNIMNVWRESRGLVVILLVVLAVLSGQLPAQPSHSEESRSSQDLFQGTSINARIAIMVGGGSCGSQRQFDHIMSCGRGE